MVTQENKIPNQSAQQEASPPASGSSPNDNIYPTISIEIIQNPSRFYAIPLIGLLSKMIILIPVIFELMLLAFLLFFISIINAFMVLFKGKYWEEAYKFNLGFMRFHAKFNFFLYGLTNKYPGFSLDIKDNFTVDIPMPQSPGKFFAIPLIGALARGILLIPFSIFIQILNQAVGIGVFLVASFYVLFKAKYPETIFELVRDTTRLSLASFSYSAGLSDKYPSFSISWRNKEKKLILIAIAVLLFLSNMVNSAISGINSTKKIDGIKKMNNQNLNRQGAENWEQLPPNEILK